MRLAKKVERKIIKDYRVIDSAWDEFSDYIGVNGIQTPLTLKQFENIFTQLNKNGKYSEMKEFILESFRYDCYAWPLVKRD